MDTQAQRQDEEKKKAAPVLPNLLGGARGAGGLGGLGSGSGGFANLLARLGLGSGVLATKAGLVALIMAGTTMAGGLGWLGYKIFGPSDADRVGASYSLFSPRPKDAAGSASAGAAGGDSLAQGGGQSSIDQLKAANGAGPASAEQAAADKAAADKAAADKAAADKAAADKAAADKVAAAKKAAEANKGNVMGNQAGKLKSDMRVGQLSKMGGSGVGGGGSSAMMAKAPDAKGNGLGAFSTPKTAGSMARASMARALGNLGAGGQARAANAEQAGTSYGGGGSQVYDGAGAPIGGAGQSVGGGGAGSPSGGSTNPSAPTPAAGGPSQFPTPPTPTGNNVTPWQHALDLAVALIAIASLIIMFGKQIASKMGGASPGMIYALAAIVAVLGVAVMAIGHTIAGGQFGQSYQGGMFMAAGAALMVGAAAMMYSQATSTSGKAAVPANPNATPPTTGTAAVAPGIMNGPQASTMQMVMILSGASAMGLAMMGAMKPMAQYDQSTFPNGAPDLGYYSAPSHAAPQYVVLGELHGSDSRDS